MSFPPDNWAGQYILAADGITPVPEYDLFTWADWMQTADRRVAEDYDEGDAGKTIRVSTVFLGLDHNFVGGPPLLWETMVFGGLHNGDCVRYASHADALIGHQEVCQRVGASLANGSLSARPAPTGPAS